MKFHSSYEVRPGYRVQCYYSVPSKTDTTRIAREARHVAQFRDARLEILE